MIQVICAAESIYGIFGQGDSMPWKPIKEDFAAFKKHTIGTTLVMGSNTYKSLPGKLPGRLHYVVSRDPSIKGADKVLSPNLIHQNFSYMKDSSLVYSAIGGVQLIDSIKQYADKFILTEIVLKSEVELLQDKDTVYFPIHETKKFLLEYGFILTSVVNSNVVHDQVAHIIESTFTKEQSQLAIDGSGCNWWRTKYWSY